MEIVHLNSKDRGFHFNSDLWEIPEGFVGIVALEMSTWTTYFFYPGTPFGDQVKIELGSIRNNAKSEEQSYWRITVAMVHSGVSPGDLKSRCFYRVADFWVHLYEQYKDSVLEDWILSNMLASVD